MAASHSNLCDALNALSSWVTMQSAPQTPGVKGSTTAHTQGDLMDEFYDSNALDLVLRRIINNGCDVLTDSTVRSSLSAFLTAILQQIPCVATNGDNSTKVKLTVLNIMKALDGIRAHLVHSLSFTMTKSASLEVDNKKQGSSPGVIAGRVSQAIRLLYATEKKRKTDFDRSVRDGVHAGSTTAASQLQVSLSLIDEQVDEINQAQTVLNGTTRSKDEMSPVCDKEKSQMQKVFTMREMSLDKMQLLLDVSTVLCTYCTVLYHTVLYCTILYTILTILNDTMLHLNILYCTVLYYNYACYNILRCTVQYYTVLCCIVLSSIALYYALLYNPILLFIVL